MTTQKSNNEENLSKIAQKSMESLSRRSLYMVIATQPMRAKKDIDLENSYLLARVDKYPDQFKWMYMQAEKEKAGEPIKMKAQQQLFYVCINTPEFWYRFVNDFLIDDESLDKGDLPKNLDKTFYVYDSKETAESEMKNLISLRDKYYDGLMQDAKVDVDPIQLVTVDFMELFFDYCRREVTPEVINNDEFIKRFKNNEKQK